MIQKNRCLQERLYGFAELLKAEEKSKVTIEKYLRDAAAFLDFLSDKELNKEIVLEYKEELVQKGYAVRSVNSMLARAAFVFLTQHTPKSGGAELK